MIEYLRIKSKTSLKTTGNIETEANELRRRNEIIVPAWIHVQNLVQNHVQNRVQNCVQNRVRKIKNIANQKMSFLKSTDPKKRDIIVNEFLETRQIIQQNFLSDV